MYSYDLDSIAKTDFPKLAYYALRYRCVKMLASSVDEVTSCRKTVRTCRASTAEWESESTR